MVTTVFAEMQQLFAFPHKEARYEEDGVMMCHTDDRLEVWHKGNEYGVCDRPGKPTLDIAYTAAEPNANDPVRADFIRRVLSSVTPLPQAGLCFGYMERGQVTGFIYLYSPQHCEFRWMISPSSGLMKALPCRKGSMQPDLRQFWKLFKQRKLIDVTERVAKATLVINGSWACRMEGVYYASMDSPAEVLADPRAWFEGKHPLQETSPSWCERALSRRARV